MRGEFKGRKLEREDEKTLRYNCFMKIDLLDYITTIRHMLPDDANLCWVARYLWIANTYGSRGSMYEQRVGLLTDIARERYAPFC